tara:strand:+ start:1708 stop:2016 length:309 start_codon:yes stop_codon:yes gene_type:complete
MIVKILKLNNQEEVLCELAEEKDDIYVIKNPCVLLPTQSQNIAMAPWLPFGKVKELEIKKELVMFIVDVIDEIEKQYTTQFSAVIAPKSKIIAPSGPLGLAT